MKKILSLLTILALFVLPVFSEEIQEIQNKDVYFGVNIDNKNDDKDGKQVIVNHKTFFTVNIIHNGKIKQENNTKGQ